MHSYERLFFATLKGLAPDDPQATSGVLFRQCALLDGHHHRRSLVKCPQVVVLLALTFHRQQFRGSVRLSSQCSLQFVFNRIKDFSGKDVGLRLQCCAWQPVQCNALSHPYWWYRSSHNSISSFDAICFAYGTCFLQLQCLWPYYLVQQPIWRQNAVWHRAFAFGLVPFRLMRMRHGKTFQASGLIDIHHVTFESCTRTPINYK